MAFALRSGIINPDGYMIRDPRAVPAELRSVIFQAVREQRAWCAWKDHSRTSLLTCKMLLEQSRAQGSPVLNVQLYGEDGALKDSDSWVVDSEGKWSRRAGQNDAALAAP